MNKTVTLVNSNEAVFFMACVNNLLIYVYFLLDNLLSGESIHPYCSRIKQGSLITECTDDRGAVALCNLVEYKTNLNDIYQVGTGTT